MDRDGRSVGYGPKKSETTDTRAKTDITVE